MNNASGLNELVGKEVMLFCMNYIYYGTLTKVNDTCVLLKDPSIVYETGEFNNKKFKDAQELPYSLYIQSNSIESFCETNKS